MIVIGISRYVAAILECFKILSLSGRNISGDFLYLYCGVYVPLSSIADVRFVSIRRLSVAPFAREFCPCHDDCNLDLCQAIDDLDLDLGFFQMDHIHLCSVVDHVVRADMGLLLRPLADVLADVGCDYFHQAIDDVHLGFPHMERNVAHHLCRVVDHAYPLADVLTDVGCNHDLCQTIDRVDLAFFQANGDVVLHRGVIGYVGFGVCQANANILDIAYLDSLYHRMYFRRIDDIHDVVGMLSGRVMYHLE